jgi:sugar phosphate isomerase/epimerase
MTRLDRRTFIQTSIGAVGAAVLAPRPATAASIKKVGMQLYTVRGELEKDFDGTLAKVAAIGYKEVEFAGYFGRTPQQVKAALRKHGLSSPAAHIDYPTVSDAGKWAKALDAAKMIGHQYLVNPWIDETLRNEPDFWKRAAATYNTAGRAAAAHGIQFCYHNHNFEFYPRQDAGGQLPMDLLLEACDPKLVKIELDLCWIAAAGKDPDAYFRKYPARFPLVHVKGLRRVPPSSTEPTPIPQVLPEITDVGHDDVIDWKEIFAASKPAGIAHYFVEHDVPTDAFASLKASYDYLSRLSF